MKCTFTLLFLLCGLFGFSQVTVSTNVVDVNESVEVEDVTAHFAVINGGSTPAEIFWRVVKPEDMPGEWDTQMCDVNLCYNFNFDECPGSKPNEFASGQQAEFIFHLWPRGKEGISQICIELYDSNSFDNLVEEVCINFDIKKSSSIVAQEIEDMYLFPNPATDGFSIKNDEKVSKLAIYNIVGKKLMEMGHSKNASYDISHLDQGLYLVRMYDNQGQVMKVSRLSKRYDRP